MSASVPELDSVGEPGVQDALVPVIGSPRSRIWMEINIQNPLVQLLIFELRGFLYNLLTMARLITTRLDIHLHDYMNHRCLLSQLVFNKQKSFFLVNKRASLADVIIVVLTHRCKLLWGS